MIDADTPLRGLPLAVVDFEATGFAGPDAHVVEVAVVHATFGSDDVRVAFSTRVRPPITIPADSTRVHGITDADVVGAPTWREVAPGFAAACAGRLVVAYNAPGDFIYADTESARIDLQAPRWPWLCLQVVRRATKTRGRPGRLHEIAAEFGIVLDAHGATGDALSTALLVRPMMRAAVNAGAFRGPEGAQPRGRSRYDDDGYRVDGEAPPPCPKTLGELLAWQRAAALWQEVEWARYRREQNDALPPESRWHVLEGVPSPTWEAPKRSRLCPGCSAPPVMAVGKLGALEVVDAADGQPHACAGHTATHR